VRINEDNTETVLGTPMTNVLVGGATARTFTPADFGVAELRGQGIAIDMQADANQFNSYGFDNIQFSPEPSAAPPCCLLACDAAVRARTTVDEASMSARRTRLHSDRAAGRHRHHRGDRRDAATGAEPGARPGKSPQVRQRRAPGVPGRHDVLQ
jgi:hypothetical protein